MGEMRAGPKGELLGPSADRWASPLAATVRRVEGADEVYGSVHACAGVKTMPCGPVKEAIIGMFPRK